MLLKLWRHDVKSLSRWLLPVMIGIGGAAVLGFINTLILGNSAGRDVSSAGQTVLMMSAVGTTALIAMALAAAATVIAVLIFVKFYKSMVTDEAYLTFTLPVTAGQLIASKFLSAALWTLIGGAVIAAACGIIGSGVLLSGGEEFRADVGMIFGEMADSIRLRIGMVVLLGVCLLTRAVRSYFQITCAILFGSSIVRKYKALAAVGMVFAVNFAVNLILSLAGVPGIFETIMDTGFGSPLLPYGMRFSASAVLWIQIGLNVILTAVFWWWSWRIAKKSVNIE